MTKVYSRNLRMVTIKTMTKRLKKKTLGAEGVTQWQGACLARLRNWVQSLAPMIISLDAEEAFNENSTFDSDKNS